MLAFYRSRFIKNLNIAVHDLHKPFDARHATLKLLRKLNDSADRGN